MSLFNLKQALAGKSVETRDGRKVTDVHHFSTSSDDEKVGAVIDGSIKFFHEDGTFLKGEVSEYDLFMAEEKLDVWINVWKDEEGEYFTVSHLTEKEVEEDKSDPGEATFIKTEKITITI